MERKRFFVLAIFIIVYVVSYANLPFLWQDDGVPIRKGSYVEWTGVMAPIGDDKVIAVWSDARNGNRELWVQAFNENGLVWNNGESVLAASSNTANESPVITATSDGNAIIAWVDYDYKIETGSIYAQKISADGQLMWDEKAIISRNTVMRTDKERNDCLGERCPYYPYTMDSLEIVPNNEGGAYIFWFDERNRISNEIYGMHLNSEGQPYSEGWIEGGILFTSGVGDKQSPKICPDGTNGVILGYVIYNRNDSNSNVKRILADGTVAWENNLPTGEEGDYFYEISVAPFSENAYALAFVYGRDRYRKVAANVINVEGEFLWEDALPVDIDAPGSNFNQFNPRCVNTVDGYFAVVWLDDRERGDNIYAQKFDIEGNRHWGDRGVKPAELNQGYFHFNAEADNEGGIIVVWEDLRSGGYEGKDIYMQHISSGGELRWDNGKPIAEAANQSFEPAIKFSGDDLFVVWGELRDFASGIYVQGYNIDYEQIFADRGELIYAGLSDIARKQNAVRNGDYIYVVWQDGAYDSVDRHIRVQKIDNEGNIHFAENGIRITEQQGVPQNSGRHQDMVSIDTHHSGGIVVAWLDIVDYKEYVNVQAIDPEGELLWDTAGQGSGLRVTIDDNRYTQDNPIIRRDDESYIIAWDHTSNITYERHIRAQKINDGNRMWGDGGRHIAGQSGQLIDSYTVDIIDDSYFVWRQLNQGDYRLFVGRFDENGQPVEGWDENGVSVIVSDPEKILVQRHPVALMTDEGLLLLWTQREINGVNASKGDIYGQLISEHGDRLWGDDGKEIAAYDNDQLYVSAQYDEGYVYLAFIDGRENLTRSNISYQKIDLQGNLLWGEYASYTAEIDESLRGRWYPQLLKSGNSILITWRDFNRDLYRTTTLRMQLVSASSGQRFWGDEGLMVSDCYQGQEDYQLVLMDNQNAFLVWADLRSRRSNYGAIDLFAQKIDMTYALNVDEDVISPVEKMTLYANYPNPFNPDTNISFAISRNDLVNLSIYNIRGQLVKTLINKEYREQGNHNVLWNGVDNNGSNVSSGVYFYKLESDKESRVKKMILMK